MKLRGRANRKPTRRAEGQLDQARGIHQRTRDAGSSGGGLGRASTDRLRDPAATPPRMPVPVQHSGRSADHKTRREHGPSWPMPQHRTRDHRHDQCQRGLRRQQRLGQRIHRRHHDQQRRVERRAELETRVRRGCSRSPTSGTRRSRATPARTTSSRTPATTAPSLTAAA